MRSLVVAVVLSLTALGAHAENKASLGLALTKNKSVEVCSGEPVDTTCEDSALGYRLALAYHFSPQVAFELAYDDFGDIEKKFNGYYRIETTRLSGDAVGGYLRGRLPAGERVTLTGKLGVASWKGEFAEIWDDPRFPSFHQETHESDSGKTFVVGAGVAVGWVELGLTRFADVADEALTQLSLALNIPLGR